MMDGGWGVRAGSQKILSNQKVLRKEKSNFEKTRWGWGSVS